MPGRNNTNILAGIVANNVDGTRLDIEAGAPVGLLAPGRPLEIPMTLEPVAAGVLTMFGSANEPLTCGQIGRQVGLPLDEVRAATRALCSLGLLKRLNTLIESYVSATLPTA